MDDLQGDVASCRRTHTACALPTAPPPPPGVRAPPHWSLYPLAMLMQSSRERGPTAGILRAPATASLSPPRTTAPPAQTRTISPVRVRVGVRRSVFALWPTRPCLRLIVALWPTPTERLFHWPQRDCANWHSRPRGCNCRSVCSQVRGLPCSPRAPLVVPAVPTVSGHHRERALMARDYSLACLRTAQLLVPSMQLMRR